MSYVLCLMSYVLCLMSYVLCSLSYPVELHMIINLPLFGSMKVLTPLMVLSNCLRYIHVLTQSSPVCCPTFTSVPPDPSPGWNSHLYFDVSTDDMLVLVDDLLFLNMQDLNLRSIYTISSLILRCLYCLLVIKSRTKAIFILHFA